MRIALPIGRSTEAIGVFEVALIRSGSEAQVTVVAWPFLIANGG